MERHSPEDTSKGGVILNRSRSRL